MTLETALECARSEAQLFGIKMAAYRLPGWPAEQYGVRAVSKLPAQAEIADVFGVDRAEAIAPEKSAPAPAAEQRGLFE